MFGDGMENIIKITINVMKENEMTAMQAGAELKAIKGQLRYGVISYELAQKLAQPLLDIMNAKGKEIAKRHGVKPRPFTFTGFMR